MTFLSKNISLIQDRLLAWFEENRRPLPWREHYDPYEVWVSEIMLQQTQVKTVLPYFDRWMKDFPTIESVAEAKEDALLKLWEGLGYYSRARNLQKAARLIVEKHGGKFPSAYEDILALPGIGKYTAAAISSIAFNLDYAVVDGNVIRVLSRLFDYAENTRLPAAEKQIGEWAQKLLPKGQACDFNQAMMEFGALQCVPASPDCGKCPLNKVCESNLKGTVSLRPNRGPKKTLEEIRVSVAVVRKEGKIFIQKRPSKGLMGGLWEFPGGKAEKGEEMKQALEREVREETGMILKNIHFLKKIRHNYTRFKVELHCYEADYEDGRVILKAASDGKWVDRKELGEYPFPAANIKLIKTLF